MVTISSSSSTPKASFDLLMNNTTRTHNFFRPFPSYLSNKEDSLTQKTLNMINPIDDPFSNVDITSKILKKEPDDAEIGVFGAEKYFNGSMDSDSPRLMSLTNSEIYSQPRSERIIVDSKLNSKKSMGTSSVRSESSWNSQSVLLQNKYGKNSNCSSVQGKKSNPKVIKRSFLANLGCKCACYDGNAVDVDEQNTINPGSRTIMRSPVRKIETELSFSTNLNSELKFQKQEEEEEGIQRKSLEVFGSPIMDKRSIQKKLAVLPWESNSTIRTEEGGFSMKYSEEDESGSDASSDLFEIGSLTGKPKPLLASQGSDPTSPTCYAPSEVSIEWSVVTASAADFSVMSECATSPMRKSIQIPKILNPKSRRKSSSGILLGCKSHKSVRVSGDSYRNMNTTTTTSSYVPRFPTESRRKRMSGSSISRSQSPAMASHLLYI